MKIKYSVYYYHDIFVEKKYFIADNRLVIHRNTYDLETKRKYRKYMYNSKNNGFMIKIKYNV